MTHVSSNVFALSNLNFSSKVVAYLSSETDSSVQWLRTKSNQIFITQRIVQNIIQRDDAFNSCINFSSAYLTTPSLRLTGFKANVKVNKSVNVIAVHKDKDQAKVDIVALHVYRKETKNNDERNYLI